MPKVLNTDKIYPKIVNNDCELYWAEDMSPQSQCMHAFDVHASSGTLL